MQEKIISCFRSLRLQPSDEEIITIHTNSNHIQHITEEAENTFTLPFKNINTTNTIQYSDSTSSIEELPVFSSEADDTTAISTTTLCIASPPLPPLTISVELPCDVSADNFTAKLLHDVRNAFTYGVIGMQRIRGADNIFGGEFMLPSGCYIKQICICITWRDEEGDVLDEEREDVIEWKVEFQRCGSNEWNILAYESFVCSVKNVTSKYKYTFESSGPYKVRVLRTNLEGNGCCNGKLRVKGVDAILEEEHWRHLKKWYLGMHGRLGGRKEKRGKAMYGHRRRFSNRDGRVGGMLAIADL